MNSPIPPLPQCKTCSSASIFYLLQKQQYSCKLCAEEMYKFREIRQNTTLLASPIFLNNSILTLKRTLKVFKTGITQEFQKLKEDSKKTISLYEKEAEAITTTFKEILDQKEFYKLERIQNEAEVLTDKIKEEESFKRFSAEFFLSLILQEITSGVPQNALNVGNIRKRERISSEELKLSEFAQIPEIIEKKEEEIQNLKSLLSKISFVRKNSFDFFPQNELRRSVQVHDWNVMPAPNPKEELKIDNFGNRSNRPNTPISKFSRNFCFRRKSEKLFLGVRNKNLPEAPVRAPIDPQIEAPVEAPVELQDENTLTHSKLEHIFQKVMNESCKINPNYKLYLYLNKPKHLKLIKCINKRLPNLDAIHLHNIPLENKPAMSLLQDYFPGKVRRFDLNSNSSLRNISIYLKEIMDVVKRVQEVLYLFSFEVTPMQIKNLLNASKHLTYFGFVNCKLELDSIPDFGSALEGSKIKCLGLNYCGHRSHGDWAKNNHFQNLIKGLSKNQDFREGLEEIRMYRCGMEKIDVIKILSRYGFDNVKIDNYWKK